MDRQQGETSDLDELEACQVRDADDWLLRQLEAWPTRVDPDKTTNIEYLMQEAAKAIRAAHADRIEAERAAMREAAEIVGKHFGPGAAATILSRIPSPPSSKEMGRVR